MPVLPVCLLEPLWVQFSALLPGAPAASRRRHPLGCHRRADPGSGGLRACDRRAGARLGVRADREPGLLGRDDPPSAEGVGGRRGERAGPHPGAAGVRPDDRAGAGRPRGRWLLDQGARRRRGGRPLAGGPRQAGAQALRRDRWGGYPAARGLGRRQPPRRAAAGADAGRAGQARPPARRRDGRTWTAATTAARRARCWTSWASTGRSPARACRPPSRPARAGWWSGRTSG